SPTLALLLCCNCFLSWGLCAAPGGLTKSNCIFFSLPSHVHQWKLLEVHGQERRNVTLSSQEEVDGSGNGTGANDAPVADSAPAEQGAEEEDTQSSDSVSSSAQQGAVIRCPLCMEFYSEMMQHGQQLVATLCGHVFCSRCLPIALGVAHICPTCRVKLNAAVYFPIYL
uniref:RING-type domain-containing protein n=1 Tax=Taeniopygia guttata TaxID=59729 RepID=A0A674HN46_TAEGU